MVWSCSKDGVTTVAKKSTTMDSTKTQKERKTQEVMIRNEVNYAIEHRGLEMGRLGSQALETKITEMAATVATRLIHSYYMVGKVTTPPSARTSHRDYNRN